MVALFMPTNPKLAAMLRLLARLEIPDCACDHHPIPCGCSEPCDCPPILPPPCPHVLAADHALSIERWADRLMKYLPDEHMDPPNPGKPTAARPGSEAKVEVMRRRLERGEHIYHELDAEPQEFLGLGTLYGFSSNGAHPRLGIVRLRSGVGIREKPRKDGEKRAAG